MKTASKINKSELFKSAWVIFRNGYLTFRAALSIAWSRAKKACVSTFNLDKNKVNYSASFKQIDYLFSFETFTCEEAKSYISKHLTSKSASEMIGILKAGGSVKLID